MNINTLFTLREILPTPIFSLLLDRYLASRVLITKNDLPTNAIAINSKINFLLKGQLLPHYDWCQDIRAAYMLENLLIPQEWEYYIKELSKLTDGSVWALVHAAPDKRCVAWIATKERKSNGPTKEL